MTGDAITLADYTEVENLVITGPYRGAIYGRDVVDPRLEPVVRIQLSPAVSLQNAAKTLGHRQTVLRL